MGGGGATDDDQLMEIGGIKFIGRHLDGVAPKDLRGLVDEGKKKVGSGIVAFVGTADGKAGIAVGVTEDLTDRFDAVELVRIGAEKLGGTGGGGRPDMAQAGGSDPSGSAAALEAISQKIA